MSDIHPIETQTGELHASKKLKPCCVCKETKGVSVSRKDVYMLKLLFKKRDECVILNGEENCGTFIEAHKRCMREHGFDI